MSTHEKFRNIVGWGEIWHEVVRTEGNPPDLICHKHAVILSNPQGTKEYIECKRCGRVEIEKIKFVDRDIDYIIDVWSRNRV